MKIAWKSLLAGVLSVVLLAPVAWAAEEGAAHGAEHGTPQLFAPPAEGVVVALTTLVVFALLLAVLGRFAWGPIAAGLKAREERIRKAIDDADAARERAEATLREYNTKLAAAENRVREMLASATAQGEKLATDIRMKGQQEAEEARQRATRDIESAKNQAVAEIYEKAADIGASMAEKILRRSINAEDHRDLVERGLEQLSSTR